MNSLLSILSRRGVIVGPRYRHIILNSINQKALPFSHPSTITTTSTTRSSWYSSDNKNKAEDSMAHGDRKHSSQPTSNTMQELVPGSKNRYGSLGEGLVSPVVRSPSAPWQAEHNIDVQRVTQKALIYELCQQTEKTIAETVPWFLEQMPMSYFRQVPEQFRLDHIKAIAAIKDADMDLHLNLQTHLHDGRQVHTFIREGTAPGTLLGMVKDLPFKQDDDMPLTRLHVFSTHDESMSLNMFVYGNKPPTPRPLDGKEVGQGILDYAQLVQAGEVPGELAPSPFFESEALREYLSKCSTNYINIGLMDPRRFLLQSLLFHDVSGTEGVAVSFDKAVLDDEGCCWVDVAVANSLPQVALEHLCRLLFIHKFDIIRARLDVVPDGENGTITMLRILVNSNHDSGVDEATFELLARELKRAKWLDPETMELVFERYPELGVAKGEIITGFCALMHPIMSKRNQLAYSKANIYDTVTSRRFIGHASEIADLFLRRFNPDGPLSDEEYSQQKESIVKHIETDVEDTIATDLLQKMMAIVDSTLKTNVYLPDRYALSIRLDPKIMDPDRKDGDLPYGIFFCHGRRFSGYHVRFRDISRGGMRLVTPRSKEQLSLESARQYEECYGLAFAQQLKNKDIPEGGSKAVCLIDTQGLSQSRRDFVMRKSVKAFVDSIIDLIVQDSETKKLVVDRFGKKEVLYLGPDEQVIPDDINWVIKRAEKRGYENPAAFMSSKPRAGINHKEYGVTSEGVNVYLDVALKQILGIDPKAQQFTVKMTGGPDGDVAGNEMKILMREYGENCRIVGVADGSGCAEDPSGLDHSELARLIDLSLPIVEFDASKLSPEGSINSAETEFGVKARNTMHNRLKADAFLPCGGRPATIDRTNYQHFIGADGEPSSRLIVEGANLFITSEARKMLFDEAGVVIVKDSSANKGGVITSSYEICAAMLLTEQQFFENKAKIVGEVLEKLRSLAKQEAELLFREFDNYGESLPQVSEIISDCINQATDALSSALDGMSDAEINELLPLFKAHLPRTISELAFDSVYQKVPNQYIKNAISSRLASNLVYKEGTKFMLAQPKEKLAAVALNYLKQEKEITRLTAVLANNDVTAKDREKIMQLLEDGGARTAMRIF